ncbi:hypothetical protein BGX21_007434 [Mortierella sp. AD011]|nr:hypothetical protein BGX20_002875 [Mortierella sp. AD010]KAF9398672.1 hypothetical protein BGX21_007434 [Mortierella sp. AD011]
MTSCPISLGCDPKYSYLNSCFPLPACRNSKENFKDNSVLIPKLDFTGDPKQAPWISEVDHIRSYAEVDKEQEKLLLRTRRDTVMTRTGGGFGATVSSTRWAKYGSFSSKLKSGSTGPGIISAFLLSDPVLGEQISFELTGENPKKVITNYYRRVPAVDMVSKKPQDSFNATTQPGLQHRLESHEETHELKHDTTKHELVYKIEWNERFIRWFVGKKLLRTVQVSDIGAVGGLPENAMQLQLTIWDAGYVAETTDWAGEKTFHRVDNSEEYVASVSAVEITCQDPSEGDKPWPGPEATNRLQLAQIKATTSGHGYRENKVASIKSFFKISILSLIKWLFVLLSLICGVAYFAEPKI